MKMQEDPEVQQLITIGKQRGYVTYEEMSNALPTHLISSEQRLDEVMIMFSDMDIEIVNEQRKRAEAERRGDGKDDAKPDANRSNDPVRVYLRKMGSVSLLSREGEIEIAKRIEDGEFTVKRFALTSALGVQFIDDIVTEDEERVQKAIKSGKKPKPAKTKDGRTLLQARDVAHQALTRLKVHREALGKAKSKRKRAETTSALQELEEQILDLMESLDLSKKQIAVISHRIQDAWIQIAKAEKEIELVAKDARLPVR
ncbi:MAG: RNA polymerase sigma factor region1.1 domain-containing protein, partial [Myxococcota bacterium]